MLSVVDAAVQDARDSGAARCLVRLVHARRTVDERLADSGRAVTRLAAVECSQERVTVSARQVRARETQKGRTLVLRGGGQRSGLSAHRRGCPAMPGGVGRFGGWRRPGYAGAGAVARPG